MFCPQCGNDIASDRIRFCTRCSFPIGAMKDALTPEPASGESGKAAQPPGLRQRDISLGSVLMTIGVIKALLLGTAWRVGPNGAFFFLLVLSFLLSVGLLLAQLTPRQRGLTLGATLVFLGAALGLLVGLSLKSVPVTLAVIGVFLLISLFWMPLMRFLKRLFLDLEEPRAAPSHPVFFNPAHTPIPELASAPAPAIADLDTQQMKQAEQRERFSVTEESTSLLKHS